MSFQMNVLWLVSFRQKTLSCIQTEAYMGLWQMFAAEEVLNCPNDVIYLVRGWEVLHRMYHRKISLFAFAADLSCIWCGHQTGKIKHLSTGRQTTSCHTSHLWREYSAWWPEYSFHPPWGVGRLSATNYRVSCPIRVLLHQVVRWQTLHLPGSWCRWGRWNGAA